MLVSYPSSTKMAFPFNRGGVVRIIATLLEVLDIGKEILSAGTDSYTAIQAISEGLQRKSLTASRLLANCIVVAIRRSAWKLVEATIPMS